jgi:plasmid replication initiation protein
VIRGYEFLRRAFERLRGVSIVRNIKTGGVEWWKIIKGSPTDSRMIGVEVKFSDWLYNAVTNFEVLTLDRDYFRLDGGVERRVYELCRKHYGNQSRWSIGLDLLHKKSASKTPIRNFRIAVKRLAESNHLPQYRLVFNHEADQLRVYSRSRKGGLQDLKDVLGAW